MSISERIVNVWRFGRRLLTISWMELAILSVIFSVRYPAIIILLDFLKTLMDNLHRLKPLIIGSGEVKLDILESVISDIDIGIAALVSDR